MEYIKVDNSEEATHVMYDFIKFEGTTPGKFYEIIKDEEYRYKDDDGDILRVDGWKQIENSYNLYKLIK